MFPRMGLAVFLLVLAAALPTQAQVTVTLIPGGAAFSNSGPSNNVPVTSMSPYAGTLNGVPEMFYCVDYSTPVGAGATWTAHTTLLANSTDYSNTLQYAENGGNNSKAMDDYLIMAYLATQEMQALATGNQTAAAEDDWAIWSFTSGPDPYGLNAALVGQAQTAINNGFTVSGWQIITTNPGMTGQEFLLPSPEPSSSVLFGLGVVLFLFAHSVRKRAHRTTLA